MRALYDWTIANTYRNVDTRGCGVGDVKAALETTNFGGKCADINAIFVAMCRAVGIPARDVYGIRVAPSKFGYKELGAGTAPASPARSIAALKCSSRATALGADGSGRRDQGAAPGNGRLGQDDRPSCRRTCAPAKPLFGAWRATGSRTASLMTWRCQV